MARGIVLPDNGRLFEIRFESVGGLGAHAAGQIVASAAVLRMGLNGSHFSSYGSEKKGSVVRSFVRLAAADRAIRTSAPIELPDVVVVFHSGLLAHPATIAGIRAAGTLIYAGNDGEVPEGLCRLPATTKVMRVDAQTIAIEEKSRPNAVLIGTLTAALPFLDRQAMLNTLEDTFAGRHPEAVAANERAFRRGAEEFEIIENIGRIEGDLPRLSSNPLWGYRTAPIGGVLPTPGNTAHNDLHTSRNGWMPVLDADKCIHCGMCDMVCPDLCLVWSTHTDDDGKPTVTLDGIDYQYCKGCMRCVETCSTLAMTREAETPGKANRLRVPLFPELMQATGGKHVT
ncbi:MAG: 2-oxoacid:acceptor oxidoreductase family protein [Gammaproteobacteria bacterium]|nr:2-oxoacid:acceptor oxidoreductase family protein [Gammaproteobacteria bacterium]